VARLHALGSRPTFELVDEIIRHHPDLEDEIDKRIDKYADLNPDLLKHLGADRFPPVPPPRLVGGRQWASEK
jgi:succinylglutamate desuccinylase